MSSTFIDGPAAGVVLNLGRYPILLRVTRHQLTHRWDALDAPHDACCASELIYAYIIAEEPTVAYVDGRRGGKRCGWTIFVANYRQLHDGPSEEIMRDNALWAAWTEGNRERLNPGWNRPKRGAHS